MNFKVNIGGNMLTVLQIVLIILKVAGYLNIAWVWVLLPLIFAASVLGVVLLVGLIAALIKTFCD